MELIILIIGLIAAITLHELAHALVGDWLGDDTARREGRISLNPFAHIDPFMTLLLPLFLIILHSPIIFGAARPVPFRPWAVRYGKWGIALIAFAGPATNLLIAIILAIWIRFIPVSDFAATILLDFIRLNIGFALFNLVPFPPLDGSRLLYAAAPPAVRDVMDRIEQIGLAAILLFMFVIYPFVVPVLATLNNAILRLLLP